MFGGAGEAVADLKQLLSLAEKFGYSEWIQFDASIVCGLSYYTGIVFEIDMIFPIHGYWSIVFVLSIDIENVVTRI